MKKSESQYFQHNSKIMLTKTSYQYVKEYKRQLVQNCTRLFNDANVKFVLAHGNLIEYERGTPIHHDDDVDIRWDISDCDKWEAFCQANNRETKYNLKFDWRFKNINQQKINGISCKLINFNNINNIQIPHSEMDLHCDVVPSETLSERKYKRPGGLDKFWTDFDIDFHNLRKIKYLGIDTFVPDINDTQRLLIRQYGENYLTPRRKPPENSELW